MEPTEWLYIRMSKIYQPRYPLLSKGFVIFLIPSVLQGILDQYIKYTVTSPFIFFQLTWNSSPVENLHRYMLHSVVCKVVISVEPLYNFINYHNNQLLICYVFRISLAISVICAVHNEACLMQGSQ